jgi:uncharacterized protein
MNRLKNEKSAYLLQHKENPIDWWSWGPEAFQKSRDENKPIFISIGYSTCHWCHVMGKEAFSNQEIADFVNENYINIKVDREEHPDVDQYFQTVAQKTIGRGGWPLSVFATPDLLPYFTGTYFPDVAKNEMPSFLEVSKQLKEAYVNNNEDVLKQGQEIKDMIEQRPSIEQKVEFPGHFPGAESILKAVEPFEDKKYGGFGEAPKFPQFAFYEWAIEQMLEGMVDEEQGKFILESLEQMLMGGIYDHAKGGVHRYSTDEKWLVPHFEKMLYDQAGFLRVISKATLIYPSPLFYDALIQTLDYLESEMKSEDGYFFAAQDADSEGVEGLYFSYNIDEFEVAIMNHAPELADDMEKINKWFGITEDGNFVNKLNVISLDYNHKEEFYGPENWSMIRKVREALAEDRKDRIPPLTDSKGIASWNFQLISALCDCIQYVKIEVIKNRALNLLNSALDGTQKAFIREDSEFSDDRYRIHHTTTRDGNYPYFEDYVFFAESQLRVYELTGNKVFMDNLQQSIEYIMKEFFKDDQFFTRSTSFNENENFGNLHAPFHDQSYKTPLATFVGLLRKLSPVFNTATHLDQIKEVYELSKHTALTNPLANGEFLRALTYPDDAYRKIEIPLAWLNEDKFTAFLPHFSSRFVMIYHEDENDQKWQVCNHKECEFTGLGIEEFNKAFGQAEPQKEETEAVDGKE